MLKASPRASCQKASVETGRTRAERKNQWREEEPEARESAGGERKCFCRDEATSTKRKRRWQA
jgi:hypothetical protein